MPRQNRPRGDMRTKLYDSAAWKRTRLLVLTRDAYTCVRCDRPARSVHHVTPAAELVTLGRDPLDPGECVTLCARCHGLADSPPKPPEVKPNRLLWRARRD